MTKTIIVWYRGDLRIHDHPALAKAVQEADHVVPVFILDKKLLTKNRSSNRNRFLLECLQDLKESLMSKGGNLVIRDGNPSSVLKTLADETSAGSIYYIADYSPYALRRDKKFEKELQDSGVEVRSFGGKITVNALQKLTTKGGDPYKVFTPFWKNWSQVKRRDVVKPPTKLTLPSIKLGKLPSLESVTVKKDLSANALKGGETEARKRFNDFIKNDIDSYHENNNMLANEGTSRLSAYIHFGCISTREMETQLPDTKGARSWHRQLAWRDFYYYVLFHFPHPEQEFQKRYRDMKWSYDKKFLSAWQDGKTGYPIVDAAMRQLKQEGWIHNRGRLIVGSFLTKDLGLDWRSGERHFMNWLIDGDTANNNGNWQWVASVGVDPAPLFRRLYNPSRQRDTYDPTGEYVRKYVPELKNVPDKFLSEPWTMSEDDQKTARCIIGKDYPSPIVDHKAARAAAIERYNG